MAAINRNQTSGTQPTGTGPQTEPRYKKLARMFAAGLKPVGGMIGTLLKSAGSWLVTPVASRPRPELHPWKLPFNKYDLKKLAGLTVLGGPPAGVAYGLYLMKPALDNAAMLVDHYSQPITSKIKHRPLTHIAALLVTTAVAAYNFPAIKDGYNHTVDYFKDGFSPNSTYITNAKHMGVAGILSHAMLHGAADSERAGGDALNKAENFAKATVGYAFDGVPDVGDRAIRTTVSTLSSVYRKAMGLSQTLDPNQTVTVCTPHNVAGDMADWDSIADKARNDTESPLYKGLYSAHKNVRLILDFDEAGKGHISFYGGKGCPRTDDQTTYSASNWMAGSGVKPQ